PPRDFQVRAFLLPLPAGVGHVLDAGAQCGSELVRSGVPRVAEPEPVVLPCDRRVGGGTAGLVAAAAAVGGAACQCDGTHGHEYGRAGGAHGEGPSRPGRAAGAGADRSVVTRLVSVEAAHNFGVGRGSWTSRGVRDVSPATGRPSWVT